MTAYEQMLLDIEAHKEEWQKEARTDERLCTLIELVENGYITPDLAAKSLGITIEEFNLKVKKHTTSSF